MDGSILVVGGADAGGLVLNEASINVPTYEIIYQNGRTPPLPVGLPILNFTADENRKYTSPALPCNFLSTLSELSTGIKY